ncbi:unnamed protein product [Rotaria sordida]|uniref:Uncharacterized protein n=1 Tax=Rotaria sordida TaxID=392033 RepID=A0A814JV69_9BILA|nr:unnamed protein product [Rotaria sordida]
MSANADLPLIKKVELINFSTEEKQAIATKYKKEIENLPTFYTCVISIYALILLGIHITTCINSDWNACTSWSPPATIIFLIFLAFEAISFSIFTAIMTGTQLYSIYTDTTGIESFKGEKTGSRRSSSFISSLKIVFGSQVGLAWLNPFSKPVNLITQNDERVTFDV